ncbi:cupin domain-containing protein [uncultured Oscillibacter sp.]|uniref:cupin domain-containing protein n=1 Tax=uncultured Oscillibacter sp. TaxID=876091 RepID=UPI00261E7293|nr:cupin domain-containing protein [uncultured Oscillibacter sp.]
MSFVPEVMDFNEVEWTNIREKIRQVCYQGAQSMTCTLGEVIPGHTVGPHSHKYEQLVFIMQGEADFYVEGIPYRLGPGCMMAIAPGVEHYICAVGDVPVLNMDIFTPKRPDKPDAESDRRGAEIAAKKDYRLSSKLAESEETKAGFPIFKAPYDKIKNFK